MFTLSPVYTELPSAIIFAVNCIIDEVNQILANFHSYVYVEAYIMWISVIVNKMLKVRLWEKTRASVNKGAHTISIDVPVSQDHPKRFQPILTLIILP